MLEISLLIGVCISGVACIPFGISALAPVISWRSRELGRTNRNGLKTEECSDTIETICSDSRRMSANLHRSEAAKTRLVEVARIVQESVDSISIYFKSCCQSPSHSLGIQPEIDLPSFKPGQHIVFHRPATRSQPAARRCYSLSNAPNESTWRITVRNASQSSGSTKQRNARDASVSGWLHSNARVGDRFLVSTPQGKFTLDLASDSRPMILIAAGVGITPIASMLHHELQFDRSREKWLFFQVSDLDHAPLIAELSQKIQNATRVRGVVACSRESRIAKISTLDSNKLLQIVGGKLDAKTILDAVESINVSVLICGPNEWMGSMRSGLIAAGVSPANIFFESFGPEASNRTADTSEIAGSSSTSDGNVTTGYSVEFLRSGTKSIYQGSHSNLLSHAIAHDVEIPSGCRIGNCGSCTVRLLKGTVRYTRPREFFGSPDEIQPCICVPTSDLIIET